MKFKTKSIFVDAIQLKRKIVLGKDGNSIGEIGDWLITEGDSQYIVKNDIFKKKYEEVLDTPPTMPPFAPTTPYKPFNPWEPYKVGDAPGWWNEGPTCSGGKSIYCCPTHNNGTVWVFSSGNMAGGGAYTVINQVTGEKL